LTKTQPILPKNIAFVKKFIEKTLNILPVQYVGLNLLSPLFRRAVGDQGRPYAVALPLHCFLLWQQSAVIARSISDEAI